MNCYVRFPLFFVVKTRKMNLCQAFFCPACLQKNGAPEPIFRCAKLTSVFRWLCGRNRLLPCKSPTTYGFADIPLVDFPAKGCEVEAAIGRVLATGFAQCMHQKRSAAIGAPSVVACYTEPLTPCWSLDQPRYALQLAGATRDSKTRNA